MQITETDSEELAAPVKPKPSAAALIPFVVFIGLILATAITMSAIGDAKPFSHLPAAVALFFAVVVAFVIYRGTLAQKFETFIAGAGHNNIVIMVLTVLLAGAFASVASASGGVESFVNLTLTLVPAAFLVPGIFLAAGIMSLATGSSTGTTAAMGPIALSVANAADLNLAMVFAAVLSGAFVGDGLSFVSDTTIVVTRGQGVKMKDKFRLNWKIAFPAMLVTLALFAVFGSTQQAVSPDTGDFNLIKVLPYFLVLITAIIGVNVFVVLTVGILASGIVGIAFGDLNFSTFNDAVFEGFEGMIGIIVLAVFIGGLSEMMSRAGGLEFIVVRIQRLIRGRRSAEVGISSIVGLVDVAIANNTAALIATNDVCKQIAKQYKVDPRRTASLMDIFCCVAQGLIPYGNQILLIIGIGGALVSPIEVIPFMWYPMVLGTFAILSIFIPFADGAVRKDPWNWDLGMTESDVRKHAVPAL